MTYYLYYAGMAQNRITEQIGLAVSEDGYSFTRVGDGLILPVDSKVPWKSLRTCNPTVLQEPGRFLMLYQGISEDKRVSIATAISTDGIIWQCDDRPALTVESTAKTLRCKQFDTTDLIEPAVLREAQGYRMWFVTRGAAEPGNRLHHASSVDGLAWSVDHTDLLRGWQFGDGCRIHYPQVIPAESGYWIYISVRRIDGRFSVQRGFSSDGLEIGSWEYVTPPNFYAGLPSRILNKLHLRHSMYSHGLAHFHQVAGDTVDRAYYHAYHADRRRRAFLDVVVVESWNPRRVRQVFDRATNEASWDSWFVGDPFVLLVR